MATGDENTDILAQNATSTVASMTPQFTGPMTQFGNTTPNVPPPVTFQPPQQQNFARPQGSFATVGERKRADRQSILQNTAQLVKSGANFIQQNKMRSLSMDIERLMEASHGRDEALQALQQNPNDPQAKAALERNTGIINTIAADPKKNKLIGKAFNVDLFGGGKNQKENAAMIDAWKNFNAKQQQGDKTALNPIAQALANSQPQRLGLSPEAAQQAAMIKAGLVPKAGEILKANTEMYKTLVGAKSAEERNASLEKAAELRAQAEMYHADKLMDAANARVLGQQAAAEIRARAQVHIAGMVSATWDKRLAMLDKITKEKTTNPIFKQLYQEGQTYNNRLKELAADNAKMQVEIDKASPSFIGKLFGTKQADSPELKMMKQRVMMNNLEMKQMQNNLGTLTQKMQTLDQLGATGTTELMKEESGGSGDSISVPDNDVPEE